MVEELARLKAPLAFIWFREIKEYISGIDESVRFLKDNSHTTIA